MEVYLLYTLHSHVKDCSIVASTVARNPKEAASLFGGEYREREGGMPLAAIDPDELNRCGTVYFAPELFRKLHDVERELAGMFYRGEYQRTYIKGPLRLLALKGESREFVLREHGVLLPDDLLK